MTVRCWLCRDIYDEEGAAQAFVYAASRGKARAIAFRSFPFPDCQVPFIDIRATRQPAFDRQRPTPLILINEHRWHFCCAGCEGDIPGGDTESTVTDAHGRVWCSPDCRDRMTWIGDQIIVIGEPGLETAAADRGQQRHE